MMIKTKHHNTRIIITIVIDIPKLSHRPTSGPFVGLLAQGSHTTKDPDGALQILATQQWLTRNPETCIGPAIIMIFNEFYW
jgi:hypothetical protein